MTAAWSFAVEPTDTSAPTDDTAATAVDTALVALPARSAAELAGELGGCRCGTGQPAPATLSWVALALVFARRRR